MNWFQRISKTGRMEKELDAELRFHFEAQVADKIQAGMVEAEARRATRLEFGGLDQVKEQCRESRGTLWLVSLAQDLRFGARILAKSPGFRPSWCWRWASVSAPWRSVCTTSWRYKPFPCANPRP